MPAPPARLDLMGGIADYSGSLVLELPLAAATFVAAQRAVAVLGGSSPGAMQFGLLRLRR